MLTCRARNKGISIPTPGAKVTGLAPDDTGIRASTPRTCTGGFDASGSSERSEIGTAVFSAFDTSSSP